MARARAAADPVVAKSVDSGKGIPGKIVGGRKPSMKLDDIEAFFVVSLPRPR